MVLFIQNEIAPTQNPVSRRTRRKVQNLSPRQLTMTHYRRTPTGSVKISCSDYQDLRIAFTIPDEQVAFPSGNHDRTRENKPGSRPSFRTRQVSKRNGESRCEKNHFLFESREFFALYLPSRFNPDPMLLRANANYSHSVPCARVRKLIQ